MSETEVWSEPYSDGAEPPDSTLPGGGEEPAVEVQPQKATHRQPLTWADLLSEVKGRRWERFVPARRQPPNPDRLVNELVTNDEAHGNFAPAAAGTEINPAAYVDPIPGGLDLPGQAKPVVVVHTRDVAPLRLFFVRTAMGTEAKQVLGRDPARRSALIVNEDAANSVSLATRLEQCTASGTLTFTLGPGKTLSTGSISELWGIAVAGTPTVSVATEVG